MNDLFALQMKLLTDSLLVMQEQLLSAKPGTFSKEQPDLFALKSAVDELRTTIWVLLDANASDPADMLESLRMFRAVQMLRAARPSMPAITEPNRGEISRIERISTSAVNQHARSRNCAS